MTVKASPMTGFHLRCIVRPIPSCTKQMCRILRVFPNRLLAELVPRQRDEDDCQYAKQGVQWQQRAYPSREG